MGFTTAAFHWIDSPIYLAAAGVVVIPLCYVAAIAIYNVYFHPLAKFPGPKFNAAWETAYFLALVRGDSPQQMLKMHTQYGPVVRVSPNELTFISPAAYRDIYGHPKSGQPELSKDRKFSSGMGDPTILNSDRNRHAQLRKMLAYGFSEASVRAQETALKGYLDHLIARLQEEGQDGRQELDLVKWYNLFVFDVIGYLTYGESFDCLKNSEFHHWVKCFLTLGKPFTFVQASERLPKLLKYPFLALFLRRGVASDHETVTFISKEKVSHRLEITPSIPNFMDKLIDEYRLGKMTLNQLNSNAVFLMAAGSGTLALQLSHVTYQLIMNPRCLSRLTQEIRTKFSSVDEITMLSVSHCTYLIACLEESLRLKAPAPITHPRYTPPGGISIDGHWVPGGVAVGIPIHAANRSPLHFRDPDRYIPERWTGEDPAFDNDLKEASQVFGLGPRDCLGRNLAFAEMRLVLSRLVWQFDLEKRFPDNWPEQKVWLIWDKQPLRVKLHPRSDRANTAEDN